MGLSASIYKEKKEKDFRMIILPKGINKIGLGQIKDYGIISYLNKEDITKKEMPNSKKKYTENEVQNNINWWFGKDKYKIDWKKYRNDAEYREKTNYYYFQARYALRVKKVISADDKYAKIIQSNGKEMTLKKMPENQSIYHNIEYKDGTAYFYFDNRYKKYVQDDGYELVLDSKNNPVYNPTITGTYNFHTYSMYNYDTLRHAQTDIELWKKYGSGPTDPTSRKIRNKVGNSLFGLFIQNNYNMIKFIAKKENKSYYSYDELNNMFKKGISNYIESSPFYKELSKKYESDWR